MTAQPIERGAVVEYPAKTLDGITRTLTANAAPDVVSEFEDALGRSWAAAKAGDTLQPLHDLIEAWWPQAMFWADRDEAERITAWSRDLAANGPPEGRARITRDQLITGWEEHNGRKLET